MIRALGDGLILREGVAADREPLAAFNGRVFGAADRPHEPIMTWTRALLDPANPIVGPANALIVEDTARTAIVASLVLIPQTWTYCGIPFGVGRAEIVGTDPAYRRRGLIRALFDELHRRCAERQLVVQGVTGIPWFYRQFGYEMTLSHGPTKGIAPASAPPIDADHADTVRVRDATDADAPLFATLDARRVGRYAVACRRSADDWRYDFGRRMGGRATFHVIEDRDGQPIGAMHMTLWRRGGFTTVVFCELAASADWLRVAPALVRFWDAIGPAHAARLRAESTPSSGALEYRGIWLDLGDAHPLYDLLSQELTLTNTEYSWYLRVPDVPGFVRLIAPALEERLARSTLAGHSGELRLNFYRIGWRIVFHDGRIVAVAPWDTPNADDTLAASFPNLTFLHLLFGYRSFAEVGHIYPDCSAGSSLATALTTILFPKAPSSVLPMR